MSENNFDAIVLWLDMLGYKNWLINKTNLKEALKELESSLSVAFKDLSDSGASFGDIKDIETILISDTIICYTRSTNLDSILGLILFYHFLAIRLGKIGLPVRGCLAKGSLLVREKVPTILLGDAIVKCASTEPQLNAFVVAVHSSMVEYINSIECNEEVKEFVAYFPRRMISTKNGDTEMHVVAWCVPWLADSILEFYKLLIDRLRDGDASVNDELRAFIPKFINSDNMIGTLIQEFGEDFEDDGFKEEYNRVMDFERITEMWQSAQKHACLMMKAHSGVPINDVLEELEEEER